MGLRFLPIFFLLSALLLTRGYGDETKPTELAKEAPRFEAFAKQFCLDCHGETRPKAGFNFHHLLGRSPAVEDREHWEIVRDLLESREMPPPKKAQPTQDERDQAIAYLDQVFESFSCSGPDNPGRVTVRRLNRKEYQFTIKDLLGVDFSPEDTFPRDEVGSGFDNIGDVLSISPLLMEKYLDAAEVISDKALLSERPAWPPEKKWRGDQLKRDRGDDALRVVRNTTLGLFRESKGWIDYHFDKPGRYQLIVHANQDKAGPENARLGIHVDEKLIHEFEVENRKPRNFELELDIKDPKKVKLGMAYLNNYVNNDHPNPRLRGDRNLYVRTATIKGPLDQPAPPLPDTHRKMIPSYPTEDRPFSDEEKMALLHEFVGKAFRRPAKPSEVKRLLQLIHAEEDEGANFEQALKLALQAVLVSPHFLFRWEMDGGGVKPTIHQVEGSDEKPIVVRDLTAFELASRLSYFLWSSKPDDELFHLAMTGEILEPSVLKEQTLRLLKDPRSERFVEGFAGQWLQIRNLESVEPDPEIFPVFDHALKDSMKEETLRFFASVLREDRSILDLIDARYTYLNEKLAKHYGIQGVQGEAFQRVVLQPESRRGGILTHASVLTVTSDPTRTSPVNRGKWVLEQLLGTPPPPPPPDVEPLEEEGGAISASSLRERLEKHREKPDCAGCHAKMDPIGFALENFDGVGRWRDFDGDFPIDSSGELPGGQKLQGPEDLKKVLRTKEDFPEALCENLMIFALGRGLDYYDHCAVESILERLKENDHRFSVLISEIVLSDPFRKRSIDPNL